jgi:hypothetical protein
MRFVSNRSTLGSPRHPATGLVRLLSEFYVFFTWDDKTQLASTTVIVPDIGGSFEYRIYGYAEVGALMITSVSSVTTSRGGRFDTIHPATVVLGPAAATNADSLIPDTYAYMTENLQAQFTSDHDVHNMTEFMHKAALRGARGMHAYRDVVRHGPVLSAPPQKPVSTRLSRVLRKRQPRAI